MNNLKVLFACALCSLLFHQCQEDQITNTPIDEAPPTGLTINVDEDITADVTWVKGNTYVLNDMIAVTDDATLTIEPCVLIKCAVGATGLIVEKDGNIQAEGNSDCPIIFTSVNDEIVQGEITSPNLTGGDVGLWSGVFILGDAPVSVDRVEDKIINMLPQGRTFEFGGDLSDDDSGTFSYVSIRHTGYELAPAEEPSGLNLGGVGSGTVIDHVELFANKDDGLRIFGGSVEISDVASFYFNDDAVDCDLGFSGSINNIVGQGAEDSEYALELDGGEGAGNPSYTLTDMTFRGKQAGEKYIKFQHDVNCVVSNGYFFDFDGGATVKLDADSEATHWVNSDIDVSQLEFKTDHLTTGNRTIESIFFDQGWDGVNAFETRTPDAKVVTAPTVGASKASFDKWSLADQLGILDNF